MGYSDSHPERDTHYCYFLHDAQGMVRYVGDTTDLDASRKRHEKGLLQEHPGSSFRPLSRDLKFRAPSSRKNRRLGYSYYFKTYETGWNTDEDDANLPEDENTSEEIQEEVKGRHSPPFRLIELYADDGRYWKSKNGRYSAADRDKDALWGKLADRQREQGFFVREDEDFLVLTKHMKHKKRWPNRSDIAEMETISFPKRDITRDWDIDFMTVDGDRFCLGYIENAGGHWGMSVDESKNNTWDPEVRFPEEE